MKFIRINGRIVPIGNDKAGQKKIGSGAKATPGDTHSFTSSTKKVVTEPKVTLSFKNRILRKINGLKNKFSGTDPRKIKSAFNVAQGKHAGNLLGKTVSFGNTKKVFEKQAIKSGKKLNKLSSLLNKSNKIQAAKGGVILGGMVAGSLYYLHKNKKQDQYYE